MDGNFKTKEIKSWISKSILTLNETGITQDIHVDELIKAFKPLSNGDLFEQSCSLFRYLVTYIETNKIILEGINVFLSIDLISESNVFLGKPTSLSEVEKFVDSHSIPEIILYKELNPNDVPLIELYRVPILFEYFNPSTPISIFYKEYRAFEDIINDGEFTRTLDVYYMQS